MKRKTCETQGSVQVLHTRERPNDPRGNRRPTSRCGRTPMWGCTRSKPTRGKRRAPFLCVLFFCCILFLSISDSISLQHELELFALGAWMVCTGLWHVFNTTCQISSSRKSSEHVKCTQWLILRCFMACTLDNNMGKKIGHLVVPWRKERSERKERKKHNNNNNNSAPAVFPFTNHGCHACKILLLTWARQGFVVVKGTVAISTSPL